MNTDNQDQSKLEATILIDEITRQIKKLTEQRLLLRDEDNKNRIAAAKEYIKSLDWTKDCDVNLVIVNQNYELGLKLIPEDDSKLKSSMSKLDTILLNGTMEKGVFLNSYGSNIHASNNELMLNFLEKTEFASVTGYGDCLFKVSAKMHDIRKTQRLLELHLEKKCYLEKNDDQI